VNGDHVVHRARADATTAASTVPLGTVPSGASVEVVGEERSVPIA
jgi:hypothetical protein